MTNTKVLLNNMFPAGICDEICNYNLHCSKCKDFNEKENDLRIIKKNHSFRKPNICLQNKDDTTNLSIQHQPNKLPTNEKGNRCLAAHIQTQTKIQTRQTVLNGD